MNSEGTGGWITLFNGKALTGWTPKITGYELGENYGNTFRVEDGILKVAYDQYEKFDGKFGHLFYKDKFSHYIIRLEYRFVGKQTPGGPGWAFRNSGIMIHGQSPESMRKDQDFPVSIEVQLLADRDSGKRSTGNLCTPGTHVVMDGKLITHRVVGIQEGPLYFHTKGDANEDADPYLVPAQNVVGEVRFYVPLLGYVTDFIRSPLGFILLLGVPGLIIIGMEIMELNRT